jgi:18S rRNA (guanine1575-N7)-methyltransferase
MTLIIIISLIIIAVLQFYPETAEQMNLIIQSALRAGFGGGTVVDYPNSSKAKKLVYFYYMFFL